MKKLVAILIIVLTSLWSYGQGTCASPDGAMLEIAAPPADYQELEDNGYCINGTGNTKWHTMCWTFTPDVADIAINAGYSASCVISQFDLALTTLYDNTCTSVGTGLTFTGLTPGNQYTWCLRLKASGGPTCNGFDRICPYWVEDTQALPVELSYLGCDEGTIQWQTATEINNDYFTIYSSKDIDNWERKMIIDGAGNKGTLTTYEYTDLTCIGETYYKLSQTDYDGTETFQGIVNCNCAYYAPQEYVIEEYNMMGQTLPKGVKGWKIIKIKKGNRVVYEKIFAK